MNCPHCARENRQDARFCRGCGAALPITCPRCAAPIEPDGAFCDRCGAPLAAGGAPGPRGDARARGPASYTPKHLAERILRTRSAIEGERKHVTVLFADLVDSTRDRRAPRSGGAARGDGPLLRAAARRGPSLRGHGEPVHRRRDHGDLRRAGRARGRAAPRGAGCARHAARARAPARGARRRARRRFPHAHRHPHGRRGGRPHRQRPAHGLHRRRRHHEPRRAPAGGRAGRGRARLRDDGAARRRLLRDARPGRARRSRAVAGSRRAFEVLAEREGGGRLGSHSDAALTPLAGRERELALLGEAFASARERARTRGLPGRRGRHRQVAAALRVPAPPRRRAAHLRRRPLRLLRHAHGLPPDRRRAPALLRASRIATTRRPPSRRSSRGVHALGEGFDWTLPLLARAALAAAGRRGRARARRRDPAQRDVPRAEGAHARGGRAAAPRVRDRGSALDRPGVGGVPRLPRRTRSPARASCSSARTAPAIATPSAIAAITRA